MLRYFNNSDGSFEKKECTFSGVDMSVEVVVDKSRFKPTLVDNTFGQRVDGLSGVPQYHFSDGKDFGLRLSAINRLGSDVTEIEHDYQLLKGRVDSQQLKFDEELKNESEKLAEDFKQNIQNKSSNQNNLQGGENG